MSVLTVDPDMSKQKYSHNYQLTTQCDILAWLDTIPLSKPVRNLEVDFADGILVAEIVAYYFPEYVDLRLFQIARNMSQRTKNWRVLNSEVFPVIGLHAPGTIVHDITNGDSRAVELLLLHLREKIEEHLLRTGRRSRLQWETWRSYNVERHRLPNLLTKPATPRRPAQIGLFRSISRRERIMNPCAIAFDDVIKMRDQEIDVLRSKLKRCEQVIRAKDARIHELEVKIDKMKPRRPSPKTS